MLRILCFCGFALVVLCAVTASPAQPPSGTKVLHIGMIDTLFEDKDEDRVRGQIEPFSEVVRKQTQRPGDFIMAKGVDGLVDGLRHGKLQMAVLHSWEYAWLKRLVPDMEPVLVAVNGTVVQRVHALVPKASPAQSLDDLNGKSLALARRSPQFVKFYVEHLQKPQERFKVREEKDAEAGIEAVIDGMAEFTMVGTSAWKVYRDRKPVRAERLRQVHESVPFPPAVLAYKKGQVNEEVLQRFRDALLKAHEGPEGRQTLTLWRISSFEPVPKNYEEMIQAIGKEYPPAK